MTDFITGAFLILFGFFILGKIVIPGLVFYFNRATLKPAQKRESGLFIKHGMIIDHRTGEIKSTERRYK